MIYANKSADLQQEQEGAGRTAKQVAIDRLRPVSTLFLVGVTRFFSGENHP